MPTGRRLSVVDVPGHERFVRTMVAGATGVDLFLLVVAADDGVMPQTREHVAILELLGVQRGVVAITKADLVDDEMLRLAGADVAEFLPGTAYDSRRWRRSAPATAVASRPDGGAVEEADAAAAAPGAGPLRLPVDRSFALKGIGTVVTGTVWRGQVRAGDELARAARRQTSDGAQRPGARPHAEAARAGQRAGVSLRRRKVGGRARPVAGGAAEPAPSRAFDAWITPLPECVGCAATRSGLHHGPLTPGAPWSARM